MAQYKGSRTPAATDHKLTTLQRLVSALEVSLSTSPVSKCDTAHCQRVKFAEFSVSGATLAWAAEGVLGSYGLSSVRKESCSGAQASIYQVLQVVRGAGEADHIVRTDARRLELG